MEASIIAQELQRFFSLFFSGKAFSCMLLSPQGEKFILKNIVTPLQPEHKIWLSRLNFDENGFNLLPKSHQLHLETSLSCGIVRFKIKSFEIYTVISEEHFSAIPYMRSMLPEICNQLEQRIAASQLISRYQQRIDVLENEKTEIENIQRKSLLSKINTWKSTCGLIVEIDTELTEHTDSLYFQDDFIDQLTRTVDLQRFLQPGISTLKITREMLPEKTGIQVSNLKTSNWNRAAILLDKYEEAANNVLQSGLTVNGKTIAQFLVPSVSPPAITDALKKNRKGILMLLHEHPGKWQLLRKNLKQVRELHENGNMFITD